MVQRYQETQNILILIPMKCSPISIKSYSQSCIIYTTHLSRILGNINKRIRNNRSWMMLSWSMNLSYGDWEGCKIRLLVWSEWRFILITLFEILPCLLMRQRHRKMFLLSNRIKENLSSPILMLKYSILTIDKLTNLIYYYLWSILLGNGKWLFR